MSQFFHILTVNDNVIYHTWFVKTEWVNVDDASTIVIVNAPHSLLVITRATEGNVVEFILKELMI